MSYWMGSILLRISVFCVPIFFLCVFQYSQKVTLKSICMFLGWVPSCVVLWLALVPRHLSIRLTWPGNGYRFRDFSMAGSDLARYTIMLRVNRIIGKMCHAVAHRFEQWGLTTEPRVQSWNVPCSSPHVWAVGSHHGASGSVLRDVMSDTWWTKVQLEQLYSTSPSVSPANRHSTIAVYSSVTTPWGVQ
jgi:hypothetical protein